MFEKRITCDRCGTRLDEWDPEHGGDIHAYYPKTFLDPGCKAIEDAYDAVRENAKGIDGKGGNINGQRVRLVPAERVHEEQEQRRKQEALDRGEKPKPRYHIPFYPFP